MQPLAQVRCEIARLAIVTGDTAPFTDPDGFAWEQPTR